MVFHKTKRTNLWSRTPLHKVRLLVKPKASLLSQWHGCAGMEVGLIFPPAGWMKGFIDQSQKTLVSPAGAASQTSTASKGLGKMTLIPSPPGDRSLLYTRAHLIDLHPSRSDWFTPEHVWFGLRQDGSDWFTPEHIWLVYARTEGGLCVHLCVCGYVCVCGV